MTEATEQLVSRALQAGETLLWSGRPDVDVLVAHRADESALTPITRGPRSGQLIPSRQLRPWAASLSYAITSQRLLIFEDDVVTDAYRPEHVRLRDAPRTLPRGPLHGDVVFDSVVGEDSWFPHAPDPSRVSNSFDPAVNAERAVKAFKALADVDDVRRQVADWLRDHQDRVQRSLREFLGRRSAATEGSQRVRNDRLGMTVLLPAHLDIRVRERGRPSGTSAAEEENWRSLADADDWNTLEARAGADFHVELELMDTPEPTITLQWLKGGVFSRLFTGKLLAVRERLTHGSFQGFSVTRRVGAPRKSVLCQTMLFDGHRQLYIQGRWIDAMTDGEQAFEAIVDSLEVAD